MTTSNQESGSQPKAVTPDVALRKFPDFEARTSRETFTSKLVKLCNKLDAKNVATLTDKHWFHKEPTEGTVAIVCLWVVGSYARGAVTCGDLDLVVEFNTEGIAPSPATITKAFFGTHANVRIYWGTPAKNTSGAVFEEAVLLWSRGKDWAAAIAAIPVNPAAKRFDRAGDAIPFRTEQHRLDEDDISELVKLRESGVLKWRFVPLSELVTYSSELRDEELRGYDIFCEQSAGKRRLAPLAYALARQLADEAGIRAERQFGWSEKSLITAAGIRVYAEQHSLRLDSLDSLECSAVAFIPALSTRGPNGAWVIERGPNHSLVELFSSVSAWTLNDSDSVRGGFRVGTEESGWWLWVDAAELFASREQAQDAEDEFASDVKDEEDELLARVPVSLAGEQLLVFISGQDVLMLPDDEVLPLTREGLRYCRASGEDVEKVLSADQVVERLNQLAMET